MSRTEDKTTAVDDDSAEVDLALRAASALFPRELAAALLPTGTVVTKPTWVETQVALRERRLDRLLAMDVADQRRWLHVEWMLAWTGELPFRVWEYHNLAATAAMNEARALLPLARKEDPRARLTVPTVESTVVLLTGRGAPWESEHAYRTSPEDRPFAGVTFRVEAVYQRTLAELRARGPLWLVFAPLAADATPEKLPEVVHELRGTLELRAFSDLTAAMVVVADADHRRRGLRQSIVAALPREVIMHSPFLQEIRAEGKAEGKLEGEAKGKAEALLAVLAARGLAATEAQAAAVLACRDLARLDAWLRVVASVTSMDQLLAATAAA